METHDKVWSSFGSNLTRLQVAVSLSNNFLGAAEHEKTRKKNDDGLERGKINNFSVHGEAIDHIRV